MVPFTDHYNAVFCWQNLKTKIKIGTDSSKKWNTKTKIEKDSWYFNNSLLLKLEFSSTTNNSLFSLITQKTTTLQQVIGGKTLNLFLKRIQGHFVKMPPLNEINFKTEKKKHEADTKKKFPIGNWTNYWKLTRLKNKKTIKKLKIINKQRRKRWSTSSKYQARVGAQKMFKNLFQSI